MLSYLPLVVLLLVLLLAIVIAVHPKSRTYGFASWVVAAVLAGLIYPNLYLDNLPSDYSQFLNLLLQIAMFGMGATLTVEDFQRILRMPKAVFIGAVLQFSVMPFLGWSLSKALRLPPEITLGMILLGASPGGISSNVITYLAKGNVALSVTMTAVSTLLAPVMTPLMVYLYARETVDVDYFKMFLSIINTVVVPVALGLIVNILLRRFKIDLARAEKFLALVQVLPQWHTATLGLSLLSLALVLYAPRLPHMQRVPGPLVAMLVATVLQAIFQWDGVATIGSAFGGIPQGLPTLQWPDGTWAGLVPLLEPAVSIALLGAIESLLSAVVADGMAGLTHDSNQELIGQGIANIVAPLFGGFAATGAIARTATNIRNGGTNPIAGITHSLTLMATLLFLAPLAGQIALGALAAILFVVAYNMSDLQHFFHIARGPSRPDVLVLLLTFTLTVLVDLVAAVLVGVVLALVLRRWAKA
jgi:MFS superfamily sulfate permease-like transporter